MCISREPGILVVVVGLCVRKGVTLLLCARCVTSRTVYHLFNFPTCVYTGIIVHFVVFVSLCLEGREISVGSWFFLFFSSLLLAY